MNKLRKKKGRSNLSKVWKAILDTTNPKLQRKAMGLYPHWWFGDGIKSRLNLPEFWRCGKCSKGVSKRFSIYHPDGKHCNPMDSFQREHLDAKYGNGWREVQRLRKVFRIGRK